MRLTGRSISRRNVVPPLQIKLGTATQPNQILPLVPSKRHAILATKNRLKRRISRSAARGGNDCTAESSQPTQPSSQSSKASAGVEESAGAKDRRSVRQSARQRWGNTADAPSTAAEGAVEVRHFFKFTLTSSDADPDPQIYNDRGTGRYHYLMNPVSRK